MPHIVDQIQAEGQLNGGLLVLDTATQATINGTLALLAASVSNQFFTGTTAGQIVDLPDATTLKRGTVFQIWNVSTQDITVRNFAGTALRTVRADTKGTFVLRTNGTAAGNWVSFRSLLTDYAQDAVIDTSTTTTSVAYALMNTMTLTPPRGIYKTDFSTSLVNSNNGAQRTFVGLFVGGVLVGGSEQAIGTGGGAYQSVSVNQIVSVNGSQAVEIQWRVAGGTSTALARSLSVQRVD